MFAVNCAARRFNALANQALAADGLSFLEGLVLVAILFESPRQIKPSQLAETFATTRGNISHSVSSLEAKGLLQRKIDQSDARPLGSCALKKSDFPSGLHRTSSASGAPAAGL